jgi:hypothetical protein
MDFCLIPQHLQRVMYHLFLTNSPQSGQYPVAQSGKSDELLQKVGERCRAEPMHDPTPNHHQQRRQFTLSWFPDMILIQYLFHHGSRDECQ